MIGIYKIQSKVKPGKIYIGSAVNINKRWSNHKIDLFKNKHDNSKLQNHYNKYGKDDLIFSIIVGCSKETLIAYEQFYIDALNPWFNICPKAGSTLGIKASEETKQKLREIGFKRRQSEETKLKCSLAKIGNTSWLGKTHTEKWKLEASERSKGNKNWVGKIHTEESKNKMSIVQKNHKPTKVRMVINSHTGIFYSSGKEAYESLNNASYSFFIQMLNGTYKNKTDFIYI